MTPINPTIQNAVTQSILETVEQEHQRIETTRMSAIRAICLPTDTDNDCTITSKVAKLLWLHDNAPETFEFLGGTDILRDLAYKNTVGGH